LGRLLGSLTSPVQKLAYGLNQTVAKVVYAVDAVGRKNAEQQKRLTDPGKQCPSRWSLNIKWTNQDLYISKENRTMADITIDQIVDRLDSMTLLEVNELVKKIEDKYGVSATPVAGAAAPAG